MSEQKPPLSSIMIVVGVGAVPLLVGTAIVLMAADVIQVPPESLHAPRWVIATVGWAFGLSGTQVILMALKDVLFGDSPVYRWVSRVLVLIIMLVMVVPFHWVAFGPGERQFSTTISLPIGVVQRMGNEMGGRLTFGVFAILADIYIVFVALRGRRS